MKGHQRIIEARMKGVKPARFVFVDVCLRSNQEWLAEFFSGQEKCPGYPMGDAVFLEQQESALLADWSWCVGLKIQVDGDDLPRVEAAHHAISRAGAARVVSSCVLSRDDIRYFDTDGVWK